MKIKILRISLFVIIAVVILAFVLPNLLNDREKKAFSDEHRLYQAKHLYDIRNLDDSVTVQISDFYNRGTIANQLFGIHYRSLWNTPIRLPVFNTDSLKGGLRFDKVGGGQQTFSVELIGENLKTYTLRSVNKDQSRALPAFLQYSFLRPLFRDQASALNPFGALVTERLEKALNILHTTPKMYFIPYDSTMPEIMRTQMAGRVMILEEEPDESWESSVSFNYPDDIISTEEAISRSRDNRLVIDSLEYLKGRLLDFVISDWDRHGGQYEWAVYHTDGNVPIARPITMDRDMAFFKFDDGLLNHVALAINNKFQSFNPHYDDISGLIRNSKDIDHYILNGLPLSEFLNKAHLVQNTLTDSVINEAFKAYPPPIYKQYGEEHAAILKQRRQHLDSAATVFHQLITY